MNIFDKLASADYGNPFVFGAPLNDLAAIGRRQNSLAQVLGNKGFRLYPGKPQKLVGGKTRAERKAERTQRANEATATYHANLETAREKGLIGIAYVSPAQVEKLLADYAKPKRKPRAKKVDAVTV